MTAAAFKQLRVGDRLRSHDTVPPADGVVMGCWQLQVGDVVDIAWSDGQESSMDIGDASYLEMLA